MKHDPVARARVLYFDLRRKDLAEVEARRALAAAPDDVEAHSILAFCATARQDFPAALDAAREAVRAAPRSAWSHYTVGWVYYAQGWYLDAEDAFREATGLDPNCLPAWEMVAETVRLQGWPDDALELAGHGLELDPTDVGCLTVRGASLVDLDRPGEAAAVLEAALVRDAESARVHALLGLARLHQLRPHAAREHFQIALSLDPIGSRCQSHLAVVTEMLTRWLALKLLIAGQVTLTVVMVLAACLTSEVVHRSLWVKGWLLAVAVGVPMTFAVIATPGFSALLMCFTRRGRRALSGYLFRVGVAVGGGSLVAVGVAAAVFARAGGGVHGCAAALALALGLVMALTARYADGCVWPWQVVGLPARHFNWYTIAILTPSLYPTNILALLGMIPKRRGSLPTLRYSRGELRVWAFGTAFFGFGFAMPAWTQPSPSIPLLVILLGLLQAKILYELSPRSVKP
jgi:Flp pilus assembly protein TadD